MSNGSVATMSTLGFILDDVQLQLDRHITYFFTSRRDQCKLIPEIPSFEWTLMQNQGDDKKLQQEVKNALVTHFLAIADTVNVETSAVFKRDNDGTFTLAVAVECYKNNQRYDLQKAVIVSGKSFELIRTARGN